MRAQTLHRESSLLTTYWSESTSIIVMIRWSGLVPWGFELSFPGSLTSTFLSTRSCIVDFSFEFGINSRIGDRGIKRMRFILYIRPNFHVRAMAVTAGHLSLVEYLASRLPPFSRTGASCDRDNLLAVEYTIRQQVENRPTFTVWVFGL